MITIPPMGVQPNGQPAVPPVSYSALARLAKYEQEAPVPGPWTKARAFLDTLVDWLKPKRFGDIGDLTREQLLDPADPEVGWGIVYYADVPQNIRQALEPLRQHRQGRLLKDWSPLHDLSGWLNEHGVTIVNRDTSDLPYYILLVAKPDKILFKYQYELDRIRAVGRLDLGDDPAAYTAYVDAVLAQEKHPTPSRSALFVATHNQDEATTLSAQHLVPALVHMPKSHAELCNLNYQVHHFDNATCAQVKAALCPDAHGHSPALSFLAMHGMRFDAGAKNQETAQGAWIGSDWQGGAVPHAAYLTGEDVGPDFYASGSIIFSLACFSAGTSKESEYARYYNLLNPPTKLAEAMAPTSFVARLPQRLLTYQHNGQPAGALAYVGHVDLSWASAFYNFDKQQADPAIFTTFVRRILRGDTVGMAAHVFAQIVDDQNARLAGYMDNTGKLDIGNEATVGQTWIDRNNARGFVVLGDPAVRIDPARLA